MITSLFVSLPPGTTYEQMKEHINFVEDFAGVSNWVMRTPRVIYTTDLRYKHTFTPEKVTIQSVTQPSLEERWKYFVITKGDGKRFYCTSQIYYQRGSLKFTQSNLLSSPREIYYEFWLPRCLVLMSELPYYKIQVNLLKVYKELRRQDPIITHSVNENLYRIYTQLVDQGRQNDWEYAALRELQQGRKITPSTEFTFNYYLTMCNEQRVGQALFIEKKTNRQVLHVYKLQSNSFYQLSYFFHLPFSSYSLRIILSAILQEKQIIFTSNNANLTTLIIETFMKMILPLKWCYMYVPNLPSHLMQPAQQSFMPYIVGISKKNIKSIDTSERVVVDIEQDKVSYSGQLLLFHSNLTQFLLYQNSDSKNYLQWEKEIRIKSLMLVHSLLEDCMQFEAPKTNRTMKSSFVSLGGSNMRSMQRLPSSTFLHQQKHLQFIEQFVNDSMMFKHLQQDTSRGLTDQTYRLINLTRDQRRIYLNGKFNVISTQAQYPTRFDNQRKYIKYYDKMNNSRRKFRFNRYSVNNNNTQSSMIVQRTTGPNSLASSQFIDSKFFSQSTIFG